jgi:thioredoxin 1
MLAPTIEKLAGEYQGKVKVGKMDTDQNIEIPGSLGISSIPTVLLFQNGKEVGRLAGAQGENRYKELLSRVGVN